MGISRVFAGRGRLSGAAVALGVALAMSMLASPAEARRRHGARAAGHAPAYAALVVDANSGRTLYAQNEDALRHPASVTKVMTLYLLFEQLEKGRYRLDTPLRVSAHASAMAPSKLGLQPGDTIEVEDAIKALVTKSANDVAAAIAENIGGDEDSFAEMMTRKARQLGMSRTIYRNASGLPNPEQVTTARDLAVLGKAIHDRFPTYYRYFSTHAFNYDGRLIRNHNNLLGRVEGVDGIKTGYTRASGFNLLTSAKRDGRHVIGVVLGGRTGRERDAIMANLVNTQIARASAVRSATQLARAETDDDETPTRGRETAARAPMALASTQTTPMAAAAVAASQAVKARPAVVSSDDEGVTTASMRQPAPRQIGVKAPVVAAASTPATLRWVGGRRPAEVKAAETKTAEAKAASVTPPSREALKETAKTEKGGREAEKTVVAKASTRDASRPSGWVVQIGATDDVTKANALIAKARATSRGSLASAQSYTEKVQKGDSTLYRARFAGLDDSDAQQACRQLKRSGISCFATKN
jgi:D-alanyl-D-alanine carboxypeptidase